MATWSGPELPTGALTFLFTDVEGSSGPWETHPKLMRSAMARHDALLTAVFEHHDGVVVRATDAVRRGGGWAAGAGS